MPTKTFVNLPVIDPARTSEFFPAKRACVVSRRPPRCVRGGSGLEPWPKTPTESDRSGTHSDAGGRSHGSPASGPYGKEATRRIVEEAPHVKVLVLTASGNENDVLEAVKAGASGYLLKSTTSDEVVDAVCKVRDGEPAFTPSLAALVVDEFRRVSRADWAEPALTARENEVIRLVAKGYTYREISTKTVQNHVRNVLTKLQLHMRY